ncbi:MAG: c-type cytochrome domain-containing protein, partial [Pirellulaceae bacterium]
MLTRTLIRAGLVVLALGCVSSQLAAAPPRSLLSVLQQKCLKCHGGEEVNGEVDFKAINTAEKFRGQPKMLDRMINAIADNSMPPEDE